MQLACLQPYSLNSSPNLAAAKGALGDRKVHTSQRFQGNASSKSLERDDNRQLELSCRGCCIHYMQAELPRAGLPPYICWHGLF